MSARPKHPYPAIKDKIPPIEDALMGLPSCPVWMHEKAIYKLCKVQGGPSYGERAALNCVVAGIEKGFCGPKRGGDRLNMQHHVPGFHNENNGSNISFQKNGRAETFSNGYLCEGTKNFPRWFRSGETITDVATQRAIVDELLGEVPHLSEEVAERRQNNYTSFVKNVDADGGFCKIDVPAIAYEYKDLWGEHIRVNEKFAKEGYVQRRAFKPKDLELIEYYMRMMIVSSGQYGKICNRGGKLLPYHCFRPPSALEESHALPSKTPTSTKATSRLDATTSQLDATPTSQPDATPTTPANFPSPTNLFEHPPTSQKKNFTPNALLLREVAVTTVEGLIQSSRIPELASLELAFKLFDPKSANLNYVH